MLTFVPSLFKFTFETYEVEIVPLFTPTKAPAEILNWLISL